MANERSSGTAFFSSKDEKSVLAGAHDYFVNNVLPSDIKACVRKIKAPTLYVNNHDETFLLVRSGHGTLTVNGLDYRYVYGNDRLSVNIELPSEAGLKLLAPNKTKQAILRPMTQIRDRAKQSKQELVKYKHAPRFAPAGQSTQLIVGATKESDLHILNLTQALYDSYRLKRVFYSAYVPVVENTLLPALDTKPPLLREHRLYQADWLLRFYGFRANELLDDNAPDFDPALDPKCCWALRHPEFFPVEVNRADYEALLRVPGIGVVSAKRILVARRSGALRAEDLKKLGVVMKRAQYFLTCGGRYASPLKLSQEGILQNLMAVERRALPQAEAQQLSLFDQVG